MFVVSGKSRVELFGRPSFLIDTFYAANYANVINDPTFQRYMVNNIADEEYLVQTFDLGAILGMTEQYYGLPRWVGGSLRYTF